MTKRRGKGEGNIRLRADGRWEARLTLDSAAGKNQRRSFFAKTRAEAARKLREAQKKLDDNLPIPPERETLGQFLTSWLDSLVDSGMRPRTLQSYAMIVNKHLSPSLGVKTLAHLSAKDVAQYISEKRRSGLSPRTVQYHHAVLRAALGQAENWDKVSRNVARKVTPPRVDRLRINPLSPEQARTLVDAISEDREAPIYMLALRCGLRQGEVLGLQWQDIDLESQTLTVNHTLQRYGGAYHLDPPKTDESKRTIGIGDAIVGLLRVHRAQQRQERLRAGPVWRSDDFGDLLFRTVIGEPRNGSVITHRFQKILANRGLPRQRYHDLRHGAATFMLAQGIDLKIIQEVLGHSTYKLTADTYTHVRTEATRLATDAVNSLLSEPEGVS